MNMSDDLSVIGSLIDGAIAIGSATIGVIFGIQYQKRVDKKEAAENARLEYKARLIGRLDEILTYWNAESASNPTFKPVQHRFAIFADQINKDISNPPLPLRPEILSEFQELIVALKRVSKFLTAIGGRYNEFLAEVGAVTEKVKHIKNLDPEWFEAK